MSISRIVRIIFLALGILFVLAMVKDAGRKCDMQFSELIDKLGRGEALTPLEQQELSLEARRLQELADLFASLITPGTKILTVDGLRTVNANIEDADIVNATIQDVDIVNANITDADIMNATIDLTTTGAGDISMDDDGIWVTNQMAALGFEDTAGNRFNLYMYSTGDNWFGIQNDIPGKGIEQFITMTDLNSAITAWSEDDLLANRSRFWLQEGQKGLRAVFGQGYDIEFFVKGNTGGGTYFRLSPSPITPPTPSDTTSGVAPNIYVKGTKFVIQYEDAGTVRYKYLELTGTGVTWVHTTVAP